METKPELHFVITDSITTIPQDTWEMLNVSSLPEGYGFQRSLDESRMDEFTFWYLVGKRAEKIVAVFPLFTINFSFATIFKGRFQKAICFVQRRFPNAFRIKLLFCGTPASEQFHYCIDKEENLEDVLAQAQKKLCFFKKFEHLFAIIFYNVFDEQVPIKKCLEKLGLLHIDSLPTTRIDITAQSVEEYIAKLGPNTRKDVRRKLRKSQSLVTLTTQVLDDIQGYIDEIYRLYLNNLEDSDTVFERFTKEFFLFTSVNMHGSAKFFITRAEDKMVAFNLCFVNKDYCIDKYIGFDRESSRKYHLYFTTFFYNLEWCIKNKIKYYQPGQTDYDPKVRLGAKLLPLHVYATTCNGFLDRMLKPLLKFIEPSRYDPALEKLKKASLRSE